MKLKLAEIRLRQGKSQADVAKASGLQVSAVSHFETGRRSPAIANLCRLADALDVSLDAIAGRETDAIESVKQVCRKRGWTDDFTLTSWLEMKLLPSQPTPDAGEKVLVHYNESLGYGMIACGGKGRGGGEGTFTNVPELVNCGLCLEIMRKPSPLRAAGGGGER